MANKTQQRAMSTTETTKGSAMTERKSPSGMEKRSYR